MKYFYNISKKTSSMPDTAVVPPRPMVGSRVSGSRPGGGNLPLLRDPDHYEEINVIGTGTIF